MITVAAPRDQYNIYYRLLSSLYCTLYGPIKKNGSADINESCSANTVVSRAVVWRLHSAMLRPHKNSDLHCAHREHQEVRLIDSFISCFENSLLVKILDLVNNRKKNDIAVIRKSKQGYVVFYVRFFIINLLCSSRSWLVLCLYIFSVLVQTVRTVYFQCFMCTNVET